MVESVVELLKNLIHQLNPSLTSDQLRGDASIVDDLGLDSIVVVELINLIEERFSFVFEEEELTMDTFSTIGFLADFISRRLSSGNGVGPDETGHRSQDDHA